MRWIVVLALLGSAGGCTCVDENATKAARGFTGATQVEQGEQAKEKVKKAFKNADDVRDKRAQKLLDEAGQ